MAGLALSRRLRTTLRDYWLAQGQPSASGRVLEGFRPQNYLRRHFQAVCKAAGLVGRSSNDLRDTFASQLLTAGVPLAYISRQLGHASRAVTDRHYAKWIPEGDGYRAPAVLEPGDVPPDLIARMTETALTPQAAPADASAS